MDARIAAAYPLEGVRAGSALLRVGSRLLAVQDDAYRACWIDLPGLRVSPFLLDADGASLPKDRKPDFEAAVRTAGDTVYLLGSGSTPQRTAIARLSLSGTASMADRPQIYDCVRRALDLASAPNVEGATLEDGVLRLFHRGIGSASASVDLPLEVLEGGPPRVLAVRAIELGSLDGVPLSITDAARLDRDRTLFLAVAEDTNDALSDGPVIGCAIGLLTGAADRQSVRWSRVLEADGRTSRRKLEGIAVDDDLRGAWAISDPDDPGRAAELCRIDLRGVR